MSGSDDVVMTTPNPATATGAPKRTTAARPNRATSESPSSRMTTIVADTQTRPAAPTPGSTCATSVTWIDAQSIAVPSVNPKNKAMTPSSHACGGMPGRGGASPLLGLIGAASSVLSSTCGACGVRANSAVSPAPAKIAAATRAHLGSAPSPPCSFAEPMTSRAPRKPPSEKNAWNRLMIAVPEARSASTPRAFIATSMTPLHAPIITPPTTRVG